MIDTIYIERAVADHPRTVEILRRFPKATRIDCERYGEIFNRRAQNFRLQKRRPALILARKDGRRILETPAGYGIGGERNYYFSHMLNCLYDCRYCFLQGMYRSAHYVLFVNYEDFFADVAATVAADCEVDGEDPSTFFSGYDCDSLAFEGVTGFVAAALPFFRHLEGSVLELRTKSVRIEPLRSFEPWDGAVVAMSFTPQAISERLEHGVPSVARRIDALAELAERGWPVGLRFDPLIYVDDYHEPYRELFESVFARVPGEAVHSVSFGPFRLPTGFFRRVERLYPDEPLFAGAFEQHGGGAGGGAMMSYPLDIEEDMIAWCTGELRRHVPDEVFFPCEPPVAAGGAR